MHRVCFSRLVYGAMNPIQIDGEAAIVTLTRGYVTVIDLADLDKVSAYRWHAVPNKRAGTVYAGATIKDGGRKRFLSLHRLISEVGPHQVVDHIDRDGLNNRQSNLRVVSIQQNSWNKGRATNNTSGFKGVTRIKSTGRWHSRICLSRKSYHLGVFDSAEEAHAAYVKAAQLFYGEYWRAG